MRGFSKTRENNIFLTECSSVSVNVLFPKGDCDVLRSFLQTFYRFEVLLNIFYTASVVIFFVK